MIYEYAVEPALLNNWKDFRHFTEKFGFYQGRLISRYPKQWKKMVKESLSEQGLNRTRIIERLKKIDDRMLPRHHEWSLKEKVWLKNAETEHGERPFRAILAKDNPRGRNYVLLGDEVEEDTPLFRIEEAPSTPRSAQKMANLVGPVLQIAKEILLIDPHFGPENPRHRNMMKALLTAAVRERTAPLPCVEIHTSDKADAKFFSEKAKQHLRPLTPEGMKVRIFRWPKNLNGRFHNRFILTDRGGLSFGDGLDVGKGEDQVGRFGKETETYIKQWQLYRHDRRTPEVEFIGTSTQQRRKQAR